MTARLLALALALALAAPGSGLAAEPGSTRQTIDDIMDSLGHAPKQQQTATGFPKAAAKPDAPRTGPTAPAMPNAPVVKALPTTPAGSPLSTTPLPGSAFPDGRNQPAQDAPRPSPRPAAPAEARPRANPQNMSELRLVHDGLERQALVITPQVRARNKAQAAHPLPLVIFLHGAAGSARQAMRQTGLAALAERAGFIAAFPEGLAAPQGQENAGFQTWNAWNCCGYARDQKIDDVGYLAALIARLKADYPVDARRIHLAGFSNGAMLAARFALERPGVVASIAAVAGNLPCDLPPPREPLPVLLINGSHDRMARFGPAPGQARIGRLCEDFPANAQAEFWVRGQGLSPKPRKVVDGQRVRARTAFYGPEKKSGRASVEYVIIKGGGHAWPGGEAVRYRYCDLPTPAPDATALVWEFFRQQARPGSTEKAPAPQKTAKKPTKGKRRG